VAALAIFSSDFPIGGLRPPRLRVRLSSASTLNSVCQLGSAVYLRPNGCGLTAELGEPSATAADGELNALKGDLAVLDWEQLWG